MAREVTYAYYVGTYGGDALSEDEWARASRLAAQHLERLKALCRVTPVGDEDECESNAVCCLAEVFRRWERANAAGAVASESIGSVRVDYADASRAFPGGLDLALRNAVVPWLHVCRVVGQP